MDAFISEITVQWAAANCAGPPTANAGQYATSNCKTLLFGFIRKWWHTNDGTFNLPREFHVNSLQR